MVLYPATQVMLMMPLKSNSDFAEFVNRNRWTVVSVVTKGVLLFDKPSKKSPFLETKA